MGESVSANHVSDKGLVSKKYMEGNTKEVIPQLKEAKDLNRHSSKDIPMANRNMKKCSTPHKSSGNGNNGVSPHT